VLDRVGWLPDVKDWLHARPYNIHHPEPTVSEWWLIPEKHAQAYSCGKLFARLEPDGSRMRIGFNVEKGLGAIARAVYPAWADFVMDRPWAWHSVRSDWTGAFARTIEDLHKRGINIYVGVSAGHVRTPGEFDPSGLRFPLTSFRWLYLGDRQLQVTDRHDEAKLLPPCANVECLEDLETVFAFAESDDWLWLDVHVFALFDVPASSGNHVRSPTQLWGGLPFGVPPVATLRTTWSIGSSDRIDATEVTGEMARAGRAMVNGSLPRSWRRGVRLPEGKQVSRDQLPGPVQERSAGLLTATADERVAATDAVPLDDRDHSRHLTRSRTLGDTQARCREEGAARHHRGVADLQACASAEGAR
jgi:hypothetical protein